MVSKMEQNIIDKLLDEHTVGDVKLVGFEWGGSVGHSRWFAFSGTLCWHVQFDGNELRIETAENDDWSYISPCNSGGFIDQDFRGCNLYGFNLSYSIFKRCKIDRGSIDFCLIKKTKFIDCTYHDT